MNITTTIIIIINHNQSFGFKKISGFNIEGLLQQCQFLKSFSYASLMTNLKW